LGLAGIIQEFQHLDIFIGSLGAGRRLLIMRRSISIKFRIVYRYHHAGGKDEEEPRGNGYGYMVQITG
jgi:hypothetical protein